MQAVNIENKVIFSEFSAGKFYTVLLRYYYIGQGKTRERERVINP